MEVKNTVCKENSHCGIHIQESNCSVSHCECLNNGVSGIAVVGATYSKISEGGIVKISDTSVMFNKQSGVSVLDLVSGEVKLFSCRLDENKEYGLFLSYHDNPSTAVSQSISISTAAVITTLAAHTSKVFVFQGQMRLNRKGGMFLLQQPTHIDATMIKENGEFGIYLPSKECEKDISFSESTLKRKTVSGLIGGRWGSVSIYSSAIICGCSVCNII